MPIRLETPMLSVDAGKMHKVDTRNVENLMSMWTMFSKCAESMEDGRRLENLSWRIWNRETLCCESQPQLTTTPAIDLSRPRPNRKDVPELSISVDSAASDETELIGSQHQIRTAPVDIRNNSLRDTDHDLGIGRGREKHITSFGLEKMVFSIKEKQDLKPLSPTIADAVPNLLPSTDITPRPTSPSPHVPLRSSESSTSTVPLSIPDSENSPANTIGSDTSAEIITGHSVVRGFSPSHISSSQRSHTHLAPSPTPAKTITHAKAEDSQLAGIFFLGVSSGDDDSSLEDQMLSSKACRSSLTDGLKRPLSSKKQTSFRDEVESRTINKSADVNVFDSDDEDDAPESAIEDDEDEEEEEDDEDGSDWEDSTSENGDTLGNDKQLFQRVDSRPNLVSRRSLLTTLMNQSDRAATFANMASKSTPALQRSRTRQRTGPSTGTSPQEETTLEMPYGSKMTASKPIIMTTSNIHPPALSPRTTRRNMLATELTESLRKHLLWERQQKSTTANAVLKRRHTAVDVANLREYPDQRLNPMSKDESKTNSWNHYFDHGLGEYHQAGW